MRKSRYIVIAAAALLVGAAGYLWRQHSTSAKPTALHAPQSPVSSPPAPCLTPSVAALLTTESVPLVPRLNLLASTGDSLPTADRKALLDSIGNTPPIGLTQNDWYSLANDILQTLRNQQPFTPEYTDRVLALWHDKTLDPTLRDYALQQLREWIADEDTRTAHEERPEKVALIQQTFLDACTPGHPDCDLQSTTTGTALLALDEWAYSISPNLKSQLSSLLIAHAGNSTTHRGIRSTALQLCARRAMQEALPIARSILADSSTPAILSLSAVSLLGAHGNAEDAVTLRRLHDQSAHDPLLQASLQKALDLKH